MEGSFGLFARPAPASAPGGGMITLALAAAAVAALAGGIALLLRLGDAWRIGRLLAAAPTVELQEAIRMARDGEAGYVRTHGRVSSDEEFPDEHQRPLVYRRRRFQLRDRGGRWQTFDDDRTAVPFGLEDRQAYLGVDVDALGDGLVAVRRESLGSLADIPAGVVAGPLPQVPPEAPVRMIVEQVSAIEHASAVGVPGLGPDGEPRISAGLGRPLIVTALETDAAMRLLASGHRTSVRAASVLLAATPVLLVGAVVAAVLGQ